MLFSNTAFSSEAAFKYNQVSMPDAFAALLQIKFANCSSHTSSFTSAIEYNFSLNFLLSSSSFKASSSFYLVFNISFDYFRIPVQFLFELINFPGNLFIIFLKYFCYFTESSILSFFNRNSRPCESSILHRKSGHGRKSNNRSKWRHGISYFEPHCRKKQSSTSINMACPGRIVIIRFSIKCGCRPGE